MPASAFCHVLLMGHSLLLFLLAAPSPPSVLSFLPTSLFPLIICYATLALRAASHWSPFLICYAAAIPSYTSRWSLSAELSITLSLASLPRRPPLPALSDLILLSPEICFSPWHATEEVSHLRRLYQRRAQRVCGIRGGAACEAGFSFVHISVQGELFSESCTHRVDIAVSICH